MLREKYGFDGVVCTDWGVTRPDEGMAAFGRTPWGVEHLTEAERHYRVLIAGGDQFGGNNDAEPVIEAYQMGVDEFGEEWMRKRFETSAVRLLKNIFRVGLFENPYLDISKSDELVGHPDFMKAGYDAQLKSLVLLKNKGNVLPLAKEMNVYIPQRYVPASSNFFGAETPARWEDPMNKELAGKYFNIVENASKADAAIVIINNPYNGRTAGYDPADAEKGGNGFFPISLQYGAYVATKARSTSIAGDARPNDVLNRTYKNKKTIANNFSDLELVQNTVKAMNGKPVIVILNMSNPTVVSEFESTIDALVVNFEIQDQAVLDMLSGAIEPSGLLPLQMPANMETVELQYEDVPLDMEPHRDSEGNTYNFGFGLNWEGVIRDDRNSKYAVKTPQ